MGSDRIGEVFPADDPESRFIVAMSMARNDVKYAVQQAVRANAGDDPEFWYLVRLSYGHLVEGLEALRRWRQHSTDVQAFLRRLPKDTNRKRVEAEKCLARVSNKAVERVRHRTFHYPSPNPQKQPDFDSELEQVLQALADEQASIVAPVDDPRNLRLFFADKAALLFALGRAVDEATLRKESLAVVDGCLAFVHFVDGAVATYLSER